MDSRDCRIKPCSSRFLLSDQTLYPVPLLLSKQDSAAGRTYGDIQFYSEGDKEILRILHGRLDLSTVLYRTRTDALEPQATVQPENRQLRSKRCHPVTRNRPGARCIACAHDGGCGGYEARALSQSVMRNA